jgi:dihydropteroate synthase
MLKDTFFKTKSTLNCKGKIINLSTPIVMGVINFGPDSFYDGGKYRNKLDYIDRADELLGQGATILDLGAASSRPGASLIDPKLEKRRLLPALEIILKKFPDAIISIDTYNASVAEEAIEAGAHIINDISAGSIDEKMFEAVARLQVPYIMMHMKGAPENMQVNPVYEDPVREIIFYFAQKTDKLRQLGVHDIILDPGFGFGKNLEDNYRLLNGLDYFRIFELPLLVGFSRKSMINKVLGTSPDEALNGTTVLNTIALQKGAKILRVHDALEALEAIKIVEKLRDCPIV